MDMRDKTIHDLKQDVAKWKNRTLEAAYTACDKCEPAYILSGEEAPCERCRIKRIREEASK